MKIRPGLLCLVVLVCLAAQAWAAPADKDKGKCKKPVTVHSVEELVFMLPPCTNTSVDQDALHDAVVSFYKWYLAHETQINLSLMQDSKDKDLLPPFNISFETLHEYFEVIRKNYADWVDDIVPEVPDATLTNPGSVSEMLPPASPGDGSEGPADELRYPNIAQ